MRRWWTRYIRRTYMKGWQAGWNEHAHWVRAGHTTKDLWRCTGRHTCNDERLDGEQG